MNETNKRIKMRNRISVVLLVFSMLGNAQTKTLSIDDCYALSKQNYPLVKQRELILKSKEYTLQNASKAYLPQLAINGQATYQSEVTQIPIKLPGMDVPSLSKDQYKLYGEINQPLYDGGMIKQQKRNVEANAVVDEQKLEVELYKLKERVNQLFFGILLIDAQLKLTDLTKNDIQNGIKKTEALVNNGVAFKSNLDMLKAELLKVNQRAVELKSNRRAYAEMLSLYINQPVDETTVLVKPNEVVPSTAIQRPELIVFENQAKNMDIQNGLLKAKNFPKFNLFVQGGYGRPALNMLSNKFEPYYIGGVRMSWSLAGLYTFKKDKANIDINRKNIDLQKEVFLFNTTFIFKQQSEEVKRLNELLSGDDEIIILRTSIKNTASAQLENGVINSNDYLREVNAEDQARENKLIHEVQLLMAQYNQRTTAGG